MGEAVKLVRKLVREVTTTSLLMPRRPKSAIPFSHHQVTETAKFEIDGWNGL
jgi:hypothetical protein